MRKEFISTPSNNNDSQPQFHLRHFYGLSLRHDLRLAPTFAAIRRICVGLTLDVHGLHAVQVGPLQRGVHVEQVGHEGQVEFAVSRGDVVGRHKLPAVQPGRLPQHQLRPLLQMLLLDEQTDRR